MPEAAPSVQSPQRPSPPALAGALERYFGIARAGSSVPTELRAGLTTFLTMSYIIVVNPQILSQAIEVPQAFAQLVTVTCVAAMVGTLLMGLVARYPFAQAPGMGLNAFFTYTVVLGMGVPWQTALGAVFISGVLFVLLTVVGARTAIVRAIPLSLKLAITAGIGLFLAFLGLTNGGIVVTNEATVVGLGDLSSPTALLALVGLGLSGVLLALRVKGAILWGILATTVLAVVTGAAVYPGADGPGPFPGFTDGVVAAPVWPGDLVGSLDIAGALGLGLLSVVFTFFFVDFFDSTGTLTGLAQKTGYLDDRGDMPRVRTTYSMDGVATSVGALMGTSTTTTYVESASGIGEGGRTGLTATATGLLFGLAMFLWPLAAAVPGAATAPALVLVGAMMMSSIKGIEWDDVSEALPAFLAMVAMPLTFSIANGVSAGIVSYVVVKVFSGRWREVHWLMAVLAVLLVARYVFLGSG